MKALQRRDAEPGRRLYDTRRWRARSKVFREQHPLCMDCAARHIYALSTETDHHVPHRGDPGVFWDESNWRALCHPCHSRKTAAEVLR